MSAKPTTDAISPQVLRNREMNRIYYAANADKLRKAAMDRYYKNKNDPNRIKPEPKKRGRPRKYPEEATSHPGK